VSARFADTRVTDGVTKDLAQSFKPGSSALFILVRNATVDPMLEGLENFVAKARVFQTSLTQQQETTLC